MNRELLSKALCEIDESFIAEAYRPVPEAASGSSERIVHMKKKRIITFALAAALLLGLGAAAYAGGWFGLSEMAQTQRTVEQGFSSEEIIARNEELEQAVANGEDPEEKLQEMDERDFPRPTENIHVISLAGLSNSPEAMACQEYMSFLESYDTDKSILNSVGNQSTGFEEYKGAYTCYTQEMADKIDEICEKYGLQKLSGREVALSRNQLCYKIGNFAPRDNEHSGQFMNGKVLFSDGTFSADGRLLLHTDSGKNRTLIYGLTRCVKGSFVTWYIRFDDPEAWTELNYITENGQGVLITYCDERAMILVERPESFVVLNVTQVDYRPYKENPMKEDELKALAEMFDFTAIP